jgi:hypothetical protein
MARVTTDPWEIEQQRLTKKAEEAAEAKKKEDFVKKCLEAFFSQEQAEILWEILSLASAPGPIPLEHMKF